jgi:FAD synthase
MTQIFYSLEEVPGGFGPSVAVTGNFDGVHRGHSQIIADVIRDADSNGWRSIAITFDPHPEQLSTACICSQTDHSHSGTPASSLPPLELMPFWCFLFVTRWPV